MRVLLTTDTVGGVWTFTQELAAGLLERGHAVSLFSFGRVPAEAQGRWVAAMKRGWGEDFRFVASVAPLEWMDGNAETFEAGASVLSRTAAEFGADLIHSSQFCWGALDTQRPIVITAHSDVLSWARACRPGGLEDSDWLRRYVRLVDDGLAGAQAVVAPTRWMADALCIGFSAAGVVRVVGNGVAAARVAGDPVSAPYPMRALSVGRVWDEGKGMSLLAEGPWPMPVVVAGETRFGDVETADLPGVRLLGMLTEEELDAAMRESAVYLCCSVYEPFGLAAVEAGLRGCAMLCRDIASLREVWGNAALYFTDDAELRGRLRNFVEDAELLRTMRGKASERAARYSRAAMTEGYLRVYEAALAGGACGGPTHRDGAARSGARGFLGPSGVRV